jgi:acyl-homoserine-lactone acylase
LSQPRKILRLVLVAVCVWIGSPFSSLVQPCLGQLEQLSPSAQDPVVLARAAEMAKSVTIYRDAYGVPHVYGPTDTACMFGFVFAQAEDYFWQVEDTYIRALGRASEYYGEAELANDLINRALDIPGLAKKEFENATPEYREFYIAVTDALNHFLATHPEAEPRLIRWFEPWYPLALGRFVLYQSFIYRKSGLDPNEILNVVQEIKQGVPGEVSLKPETRRHFADVEEMLARHETMSQHVGSNMWAVTPERSASGKALLFINPHQPFFGPGQWYEGHVVSKEGWNLSGACLFGSPFPTIGYNGHLAWSHTVNQPNIADGLYDAVRSCR